MELRCYVKHGEILPVSKAQQLWDNLEKSGHDAYPEGDVKQAYLSDASYKAYYLTDTQTGDGFDAAIYIHKALGKFPKYAEWFLLRDAECLNKGENGCYLKDLMDEINKKAAALGHEGNICVHYICCREEVAK